MFRTAIATVGLAAAVLMTVKDTHAGPSPGDIARLGAELTPLGAEKAGNADGTIPAWNGGITKPPAGYTPGMHHPDPFADDAVRFNLFEKCRAHQCRCVSAVLPGTAVARPRSRWDPERRMVADLGLSFTCLPRPALYAVAEMWAVKGQPARAAVVPAAKGWRSWLCRMRSSELTGICTSRSVAASAWD